MENEPKIKAGWPLVRGESPDEYASRKEEKRVRGRE